MIRIKKLDHIVIRAKNPERLVEFYRRVLGCPRWHHPSRDEPAGIPATLSGPRPPSPAPSHSLSWRARAQRGPPIPDRARWSRPGHGLLQ